MKYKREKNPLGIVCFFTISNKCVSAYHAKSLAMYLKAIIFKIFQLNHFNMCFSDQLSFHEANH